MSPADQARTVRQARADLSAIDMALSDLDSEIDTLRAELEAANDTIAELRTRVAELESAQEGQTT